MSRALTFAIPGDPLQRTGGYLYDRRLAAALRRQDVAVTALRLPDGFPFPDAEALAGASAALAALAEGSHVLVDGLAAGVLGPALEAQKARLDVTALVHHPLGYETGLRPETAAALVEAERAALAHPARIVVTSEATRDTLVQDFAVAPARITVALPGTDPAPMAQGSNDPHATHLLAVGSVIPRKDFTTLVTALHGLRHLPWQLAIVGSLARDPDEARRLRDAIESQGLGHRIVLEGELDGEALERAYDRADLMVSVSRYEGFGMALAEGIARGLPIVAVAGGAVGGWLPEAAALLVPPDDPDALSLALERALGDPECRTRLAAGAAAAREALPGWDATAAAVAGAIFGP